MGSKTTHFCDKCEKEVNHPKEQLWNIRLQYQCEPTQPSTTGFIPVTAQWCRPCMEEFGFFKRPHAEKRMEPSYASEPSLEDRIREIIQDDLDSRGIS